MGELTREHDAHELLAPPRHALGQTREVVGDEVHAPAPVGGEARGAAKRLEIPLGGVHATLQPHALYDAREARAAIGDGQVSLPLSQGLTPRLPYSTL